MTASPCCVVMINGTTPGGHFWQGEITVGAFSLQGGILLPAQWQSPSNRAMGAQWGTAMFHLLTLPW